MLKLTYSNLEFHNFSGGPALPLSRRVSGRGRGKGVFVRGKQCLKLFGVELLQSKDDLLSEEGQSL